MAVNTIAGARAASDSPVKTRPRSQPRDSGGDGSETDQDGRHDATADARRERPEPRVQVHAVSLEPIPRLGKRELRHPGRGRLPPELEPHRLGALAAHG